ncbi:MAG: flagellar biosynthetic protein FliR [Spirochaetales bacterium]|nr:flagellar biosynthetic protein FliR [Spirochaetales bacterium]
MEFNRLLDNVYVFLLVFSRVFGLLSVAPLLSSSGIPGIARVGLTFFTAFALTPMVAAAGYPIPDNGFSYATLVVGELLIGIIIGFFLTIMYSAFLMSGQFYSFQMGFGASVVYDPLAQVEIPLIGQFLNLVAMFVFMTGGTILTLFIKGLYNSFLVLKAGDLAANVEELAMFMLKGLVELFAQSIVIALPILGTLMLVSVTMGLLAKAAPQMNLLMLGFPIQIGLGFFILFICVPFLMEYFAKLLDYTLEQIMAFLSLYGSETRYFSFIYRGLA